MKRALHRIAFGLNLTNFVTSAMLAVDANGAESAFVYRGLATVSAAMCLWLWTESAPVRSGGHP